MQKKKKKCERYCSSNFRDGVFTITSFPNMCTFRDLNLYPRFYGGSNCLSHVQQLVGYINAQFRLPMGPIPQAIQNPINV